MRFTKPEWVVVAAIALYAIAGGTGGSAGEFIGSLLGGAILVMIIIGGKRTFQSL